MNETPTPTGLPRVVAIARSLFGIALAVGGAVFLARVLLHSRHELAHLAWRHTPFAAFAALALLLLCMCVAPLIFQLLLREFRHPLSYRDAFAIHYVSAFAKYLPGTFWSVLGMAHQAQRRNVPVRATVSAVVIELAVVAGGSVLLFGTTLLLWPGHGSLHRIVAAGVWLATALVLASSLPTIVFERISRRAFRGAATAAPPTPAPSSPPPASSPSSLPSPPLSIGRGSLLLALAYYILSMVVFGVGFYCLLQTFYPTSVANVVVFTGIYAISWLAGVAVLFVPGGFGVRDGIQAYLLTWFVPAPIAVTIALVQRAWLTLGDLVAGLVSLWLLRRMR